MTDDDRPDPNTRHCDRFARQKLKMARETDKGYQGTLAERD